MRLGAAVALLWAAALTAGAAGVVPLAAAADSNAGLEPKVFSAYGRNHYYQIPKDVVGTLVWFHGAGHSNKGFFPKAGACGDCTAMPENLSHTKQALARGYALLAMSPNDPKGVWSSSASSKDQPSVIAALKTFIKDNRLEGKRLFLAGHSGGSSFALKLGIALIEHSHLKLDGVISETNAPQPHEWIDRSGRPRVPNYPPVVWVTMEADKKKFEAGLNVDYFNKKGWRSAIVEAPRRQVYDLYLSDRSTEITPEQSRHVAAGLRAIGMVDRNGWVIRDPGHKTDTSWRAQLARKVPFVGKNGGPFTWSFAASHLRQALGVAYAYHEHLSDHHTACLAWLESGGTKDMAELARKMVVKDGKLSALTAKRVYGDDQITEPTFTRQPPPQPKWPANPPTKTVVLRSPPPPKPAVKRSPPPPKAAVKRSPPPPPKALPKRPPPPPAKHIVDRPPPPPKTLPKRPVPPAVRCPCCRPRTADYSWQAPKGCPQQRPPPPPAKLRSPPPSVRPPLPRGPPPPPTPAVVLPYVYTN